MTRFKYVLDSDSDEDIGWSRTLDLPRSRQSRLLEQRRLAARAESDQPGTSKAVFSGPLSKKIKLERPDEVVVEDETARRLNIANWPEKLLNRLVNYVPVEGRAKLRCTCKALRDAVDRKPKLTTEEIDIRRLDEAELGLFIAQDKKEGRFVIGNKKFFWTERPLLRTFKEMRRGMVDWTRHDRNRMGRIKTAIRALFKLSHIFKLTISQVNLSNSFLRDINRLLTGQLLDSLHLEGQVYEHDRPDLRLLNKIPCQSLSIAIRLKSREPLPQIEKFLEGAKHNFSQLVLDIRQDSWKFKSSLHYRKSFEDFGITNAVLHNLMTGTSLNYLRLKFVSRYLTHDGLIHTIKYLRTRSFDLPTRGFCVVVHASVGKNLVEGIKKLPAFGTMLTGVKPRENMESYGKRINIYATDQEFLDVMTIKQENGKTPLMEVRYCRKGTDTSLETLVMRKDDNGRFNAFELPRWKDRPS